MKYYTDKKTGFRTGSHIFCVFILLPMILISCSSPGAKYPQGKDIIVNITDVNSEQVKIYEKFELALELKNTSFDNPYDPADIDLYAVFSSPSGRNIRINGFYDDYRGVDKWKIRFSPGEKGVYKYRVFINDGTASFETPESSFTAVESEHHGWIRPSEINPHYFSYDDGTTYYGVGAYSPWSNNEEIFRKFTESKSNFFAIWDITYGGFVNDEGIIEEELGRYNQNKLGEIDSLLTILENSNIQLMYAIWPHDLFSETVWATQWKINPYSTITEAENVYSDSLVGEYQKMKFRYMIARFAHSRSWGIWELINEMDGTDGWVKGHHEEAYAWVDKCQKYFTENDPYRHPMTASFSGGFTQYRDTLYRLNEIPNIHLYPAQGWIPKFPDDSLRSDMYNFGWAAKRFWDNFDKPAIFGEAGANLTYYKPESKEYRISYHNQIWASLVNGLAVTPVWWTASDMTSQDWEQLKYLSEFVADIDFANLPYEPVAAEAENTDIYVMDSGEKSFGWARAVKKNRIDNTQLVITKADKGDYSVLWYDTWTGKAIETEKISDNNGKLILKTPAMDRHCQDIAFKINKL